jgi:hypothetical protein
MPVPNGGFIALSVTETELTHTLTSAPALATDGGGLTVIFTVSTEEGQTPLVIVHTNRFCPLIKLLTEVEEEPGDTIVAGDAITDQEPVPTIGIFADNVVVFAQIN